MTYLSDDENERLCIERGMGQYVASLKRHDLKENDRVKGAIMAALRQASALSMMPKQRWVVVGDKTIDANHVMSVEIDTRSYVNGSDSSMLITMMDGKEHRVTHWPYGYRPVDVYAIKKEITG